MVINHANLTLIFQNLNMAFMRGLSDGPPPLWQKYATEVPSTTREEIYPWLKAIPGMREWLGPRVFNNLSSSSYRLTNKDWEDGIAVDANDIKDDRVGLYAPLVQELGVQARVHPDKLMAQILEAGRTTACWDGQFFFDTDHPQDADNPAGTTYSNYYATDGTDASSHAFSESTLAKLWQKFAEFKKENGDPMGLVPDTVMVPPALAIAATRVLNMTFVASGAAAGGGSNSIMQENPLKGLVDLVVNPYLTSSTKWYLMKCKGTIKPLILQMRERADKLVRKDQETDDNVFLERKYLYGVAGRYAGGYTFPQLAILANT